ncbi:tautomerase family protein [Xenorhabdus khoisanae]|uniref:2-hydroxymuconate tautomerase n=1 Tax=Xenorhabdus khoisanae TaxID=880157 RepID=UPI0023584EDF|nr:2-hydroxymuconate tautomerase [Xenorhabdus khoisanae]MDC9613716.1 tautomerase family protein [Xenorhabdus khoisanae]
MPFVQITTWNMNDENQIKSMVEDVTLAVHKNSGAPLDKISVVITEISPSRWSDAGILGNDLSFPIKSRRKTYEE